jgi:uncharacterized protein
MRHSLVILAAVAGLVAAPSIALADQEYETRSISVTGQGVVVATPDIAEIGAGVVSLASSAAEALADNSSRMTAVFEGLKALGVTAREMRTSDFSVSPVYSRQNNDNNQPPSITGYRVSNNVHVRLRDSADVGRVLDRLVALGANDIHNVSFIVSDRYEKMQGALGDAVKNARARATLMAEAAGAKLGPVLQISENVAVAPRPVFAMKAMAESSDVPVSGGEETIQVTIQAVFALE